MRAPCRVDAFRIMAPSRDHVAPVALTRLDYLCGPIPWSGKVGRIHRLSIEQVRQEYLNDGCRCWSSPVASHRAELVGRVEGDEGASLNECQ